MKTKAVRIYGKNNLRLEEFDLPPMKEDEILALVVCDSLCMSSYKAAIQGDNHKRIPNNIAIYPTIIGHEFSGEIIDVGKKWQNEYSRGMKFAIQPAINYPEGPVGIMSAPGYSYQYIGGNATYIIIPKEVMENGCLLQYKGNGFYPAALAEPFSCVIGAMNASYHITPGSYKHKIGIANNGKMALLGGAGPMGLAAINYVVHRKKIKPKLLTVTDKDQQRLDRAALLFSPEYARKKGIKLQYINPNIKDALKIMKELSDGNGYHDVFVFAPSASLIKEGDALLGFDGCLNFFAGPENPDFSVSLNFYNIHYNQTHIVGTSGGNSEDMKEALKMMSHDMEPAGLVTHIGGLDAATETTLNLPNIPGGKKLIYTNISLPLTAIADFREKGKTDRLFAKLCELVTQKNGFWNLEAEEYLITHGRKI